MLDFTPLARKVFAGRLTELSRQIEYGEAVQCETLEWLVGDAAYTEFGQRYKFNNIQGYNDFRSSVPINTYADLEPHIRRMMRGERNILWPGVCTRFAQSSGTSGSKSKYIPVTADSLKMNHYKGATDAVILYLNSNPESRIFSGKGLILGGSFAKHVQGVIPCTKVGDLSAHLIENINPIVNLFRVPGKKIALLRDWEKKLPAISHAALNQNITNLSGVPSWFMAVLKKVLEEKGAKNIHEVWNNLEVFFHGGINFEPYRAQYEAICDMSKMHFWETYNASEGFFATQSSAESKAMLLLLDVGVFYEFIPIEECDKQYPNILPMWAIEKGRTYELVITTCSGLWRYRIGDTVKIESVNPLKITIAGRTKSFINAFGEELMVHNADAAIVTTCGETGASVADYTVAPIYPSEGEKGRHQWVIEFNNAPRDMAQFTAVLDEELKRVNSDYEAKRKGDIFLDLPQVIAAPRGTFDRWLALSGKLGGQRKIPRLSNNRKMIEEVLALISSQA